MREIGEFSERQIRIMMFVFGAIFCLINFWSAVIVTALMCFLPVEKLK